ncbi:MAG: hypothetical protein IJ087_05255 [Eggerthellaceae bacterium]|nr:hypothetical protein [Eggerthellaceae bacterium]
MDGEQNGTQTQQGTQQQEQQAAQQQASRQETQGKHAKETGVDAGTGSGSDAEAYERQLAERDSRIAELEAQIADAAKNAETADGLRAEIAALKEQGESDRIDFALQLAGCRNVKAARAVLADHGGDVEKLKEAEPWMFADTPQKQTGKTGFPNAGTATDEGKQLKHWEKIAGLADDE